MRGRSDVGPGLFEILPAAPPSPGHGGLCFPSNPLRIAAPPTLRGGFYISISIHTQYQKNARFAVPIPIDKSHSRLYNRNMDNSSCIIDVFSAKSVEL